MGGWKKRMFAVSEDSGYRMLDAANLNKAVITYLWSYLAVMAVPGETNLNKSVKRIHVCEVSLVPNLASDYGGFILTCWLRVEFHEEPS